MADPSLHPESHHHKTQPLKQIAIDYTPDGKMVRKAERKEGEGFPRKAMYLYSSVWDASYIDQGRWTGKYVGSDAPYVCVYKDIHVPLQTAVEE